MVAMKRYMKVLVLMILLSITASSQEPKLECTKQNLLLAVQKAAKQLPEINSTYITFISSGTTQWYTSDKYPGLTYQQRLDAIAKDKEKEAKEARELADKERIRVEDIKFIRKMASECREIK